MMEEHEKIDSADMMEKTNTNSDGAPLDRQMTVTLSPEQYERMFFQPSAPRHGDYAKRFGMSPCPCPLCSNHGFQ